MAERTDLLTITFTRYDQSGWPVIVWWRDKKHVARIVTRSPIGYRNMGTGRFAIDIWRYAVIVECWWRE